MLSYFLDQLEFCATFSDWKMPKEESYSTKVVLSDKVNIDISIQKQVVKTVQMFWEGHKNLKKIFYLDLTLRKDLKDFRQVLTKIAGKMKQNLFAMIYFSKYMANKSMNGFFE